MDKDKYYCLGPDGFQLVVSEETKREYYAIPDNVQRAVYLTERYGRWWKRAMEVLEYRLKGTVFSLA